MNSLNNHCPGYSHVIADKPCQDFSYAESSETLSIAIVCDGHGGERYFRSHYGSKFAVEVTKRAIKEFVENIDETLFEGKPYTAFPDAESNTNGNLAHPRLIWLFSSIISQWNDLIAHHAKNVEISEWEEAHVEKQYLDEFQAKRLEEGATFEKTYGCTLIAYAQTAKYWFAFQIGDGKCVMVQETPFKVVCNQPIPWDDRCFLNKTTSLCNSDALESFRYCYQGDGKFPLAVFLGSDGIDDSYSDGDLLYKFYIDIYKQILKSGHDEALRMLKDALPKLSKRASKDDMSVATVYNDTNAIETFRMLIEYQSSIFRKEECELEEKICTLNEKVELLENHEMTEKTSIELRYAQNDIRKFEKRRKQVHEKLCELVDECKRFERGHKKEPKKPKSPKNNLHSLMNR